LIRPDILLQCVYESIYELVTPLEDIPLSSSESYLSILYIITHLKEVENYSYYAYSS